MIFNMSETNAGGGGTGSKTTWYGTSSTAAGTAAKVVTCADFALETGAIIAVLFTTANTAATPTLNVNSTGAKTIYVGSGTVNSTTNVLKWSANTILVFMYDGTYFRYITSRSAASVIPPDGAGSWYGTSSTAAGTSAKASTIANFRLTPGAVVHITFSTANTVARAITLNVNSTGAKTIYYRNAATSETNPLVWDAGSTLTFVYSGSAYYLVGISPTAKITRMDGGSGAKGYEVVVTDYGVGITAYDEDVGSYTDVLINEEHISISINDGTNEVAYDLGATTTWNTPTVLNSSATITSGGFYVEGKRAYIQMRLTLTANLSANSGINILSGLPVPDSVAAVPLSILANNRGGHGARVQNSGQIQIIADVDHGITAGQSIDICGVYTIQ